MSGARDCVDGCSTICIYILCVCVFCVCVCEYAHIYMHACLYIYIYVHVCISRHDSLTLRPKTNIWNVVIK